MYNIVFNGYLECPSIEAFQIAFQQFLQSTQGNWSGQIIPQRLPEYVDYQKIEDDTERNNSSNISSESNSDANK